VNIQNLMMSNVNDIEVNLKKNLPNLFEGLALGKNIKNWSSSITYYKLYISL